MASSRSLEFALFIWVKDRLVRQTCKTEGCSLPTMSYRTLTNLPPVLAFDIGGSAGTELTMSKH
jgi:hypothetical protein